MQAGQSRGRGDPPWLWVVPLATVLLGAPVAAPADDFDDRAPAKAGDTVEIDLDFGEGLRPDTGFLLLSSHDADEVELRVDAEGWGSWDVETRLEPAAHRVRVSVRADGTTTWMFGGPRVLIHVAVPNGVDIDLRSIGGQVRVEDLTGEVRARVRDGGVELRSVEGPVKLRVVNGAVEAEELKGDFEVSTTEGDIRASWVTGRVEARTNDGAIALDHIEGPVTAKSLDGELELSQVSGPVTARTERGRVAVDFSAATGGVVESQRGDVAVTLPERSGADLDARASDGRVDLAASLALEGERSGRHATGTLGDGGPSLVLRSTRGTIRVDQR